MVKLPRGLEPGVLDEILEGGDGEFAPFVVCVSQTTTMKNGKKAASVFDGGTSDGVKELDGKRVAYSMRALFNSEKSSDAINQGAIVRLNRGNIASITSGERVLVASEVTKIGEWPDYDSVFHIAHHPLALPGGKAKAQEPQPIPAARQEAEDGYNAARRPVSNTGKARAEPYRPVVKTADTSYLKIEDLSAYVSRWTILARVTSKSEIKCYNNARGEGRLFNIDLVDSSRGEIRATFFTSGVDAFYEMLQVDKVYTFSKGSIRPANARFKVGPHPYELSFGAEAEIIPVDDDQVAIPKQVFDIKPFTFLDTLTEGNCIDVVAVAAKIFPTTSITIKATGEPRDRKNVTLMDTSGRGVELTLWGNRCAAFGEGEGEPGRTYVVLLRRARVDDYGGNRKLKIGQESAMEIFYCDDHGKWASDSPSKIDPKSIPELEQLRVWYFQEGGREKHPMISGGDIQRKDTKRATIAEIVQASQSSMPSSADMAEKGLWFDCLASIVNFNVVRGKKYYWKACPTCNKKVVGGNDDAFDPLMANGYGDEPGSENHYCANCDKEVPNPQWRYNLTVELQDHTESLRCTALGENAVPLMDVPCEEVEHCRKTGAGPNQEEWEDYFVRRRRKEFIFTILAKSENYNDEYRMKYRIFNCRPIGKVAEAECRRSLIALTELLGDLQLSI